MSDPTEQMNNILERFAELGGIDAVFLLNEANIQSSYPIESDFDFIATSSAEVLGNLDYQGNYVGKPLAIEEMILVAQEKTFITLNITDKPGYVLCVICPRSTRSDLIKTRFKNLFKEQIIVAIEKSTNIKKEL